MNQEFANKIFYGIYDILKKIKIKRKKTEMPENNNVDTIQESKPVTIGSNTQIVFTIKSFFGTILSILGIFASFYFLVVVPKVNDAQEFQVKLYERVETEMKQGFKDVNTGIRSNGGAIKDLSRRFDDLHSLNDYLRNTGGSFNTTTPPPAMTMESEGLSAAMSDIDSEVSEAPVRNSVVPDSLLNNSGDDSLMTD